MTVLPLLAELRKRDVRVWADGERLRCNAPAGALTAELRAELERSKREILDFLGSAGTLAGQPRAIVPLQPAGEGTPIFGVGGHNGDVFCYRALAQHLGDERPFFGLEPPGLDGHSPPLARVPELAEYFAGQIRAFRPSGPYILAGFCAGGTIAFELGRRLRQAGATIECLALFGAPYPTLYRRLPLLREMLGQRLERVARHARTLASLSFAEQSMYVAENVRARRARRAAERSDGVLLRRAEVERATLAAARRYTPARFPGRVCLFLPHAQWARSRSDPLRWRSVAAHTEEYAGPDDCDSDNMLLEPHAATFAALFRRAVRHE